MLVKRSTKYLLWSITAITAVVLLAVTFSLAGEQAGLRAVRIPAVITGNALFVQLREEPGLTSPISDMVERGSPVLILDSADVGVQVWFRVEGDEMSGWVPAGNLELVSEEQ